MVCHIETKCNHYSHYTVLDLYILVCHTLLIGMAFLDTEKNHLIFKETGNFKQQRNLVIRFRVCNNQNHRDHASFLSNQNRYKRHLLETVLSSSGGK